MNSLRKLERSVIMHKNYELCGSSAMFYTFWRKHRYKGGVKTSQSNASSKKQLKRDKRVLGKTKNRLFRKKNTTAVTVSN